MRGGGVWQSQSQGHRTNPAQIVCKSKQLDPKHLREALADSRQDQDKAALLCPVLPPPAISCCCINIIISPFPQSGADLLRSKRSYSRAEVERQATTVASMHGSRYLIESRAFSQCNCKCTMLLGADWVSDSRHRSAIPASYFCRIRWAAKVWMHLIFHTLVQFVPHTMCEKLKVGSGISSKWNSGFKPSGLSLRTT